MKTNFLSMLFGAFKEEVLSASPTREAVANAAGTDVITAVETTASDALKAVDTLIGQYLPVTLGFVKQAAEDKDLMNSEKRSAVVTQLEQHLEGEGISLEADGTKAAINLLVELGVNIGKALLPGPLGAVFSLL